MAKKAKRPPTRRERLYDALDELDPATPTAAWERLELWLGAILTELEDLNAGLSMILDQSGDFGPSTDELHAELQTIRQVVERAAPPRRGTR